MTRGYLGKVVVTPYIPIKCVQLSTAVYPRLRRHSRSYSVHVLSVSNLVPQFTRGYLGTVIVTPAIK